MPFVRYNISTIQVISVIRPPCLLKRQTAAYGFTPYAAAVFCIIPHPKDFKLLRYSAISSSLTVSMMYCSSLTTESRSFGR